MGIYMESFVLYCIVLYKIKRVMPAPSPHWKHLKYVRKVTKKTLDTGNNFNRIDIMNFPIYTLETVKGLMNYEYVRRFRKWVFQIDTFRWLITCHGKTQAHKVARIISGSLKRSGKVDGMGYANIKTITGV
jgi:hypothetical protein